MNSLDAKVAGWHDYLRATKRDKIDEALVEANKEGWISDLQLLNCLAILLDFPEEKRTPAGLLHAMVREVMAKQDEIPQAIGDLGREYRRQEYEAKREMAQLVLRHFGDEEDLVDRMVINERARWEYEREHLQE